MKQKKLLGIFILLTLSLITVGVITYSKWQRQYKSSSVTRRSIQSSNNFCDIQLEKTKNSLKAEEPTLYIRKNKYKNELVSWKNALISKSGWTETYFNKHIRIHNVDYLSDKEIINPQYTYTIDWASFEINGDAVQKNNGRVVEWSVNEFPKNTAISECETFAKALKDYHPSLKPEHITIMDGNFLMFSYGQDSGSICSSADINLITKEILNARLNGQCRLE